jgi:signal transduction histidine kinase
MGFNLSETSARLLFLYLAELVLALILFFIFQHFGKLYRRKFLYTWALSWLAFSIYILCTGIITIFLLKSLSPSRMILSAASQVSCFLQVIMILRGTYELIYEKAYNKRKFKLILLAFFIMALASVVAFSADPNDAPYRHLLRMGSRTLMVGGGFMLTGIVIWTSRKFSRGFGHRLLSISFIAYSGYHLYYFIILIVGAFDVQIPPPHFYGIVDVLLIAVMGMGMVMWLLEDERAKLEKANKELDRFLYSTSHDLRAPIASILGLTYLGKIEFKEDRARLFMDMIEERIKKLDLVISDILSLYRSKKIDLKIEPLNFNTLLEDTIADIKFSKGLSAIRLDYQSNADHIFLSDYNQMKIILSNLLANAVKYHRLDQANPFIRITFNRTDEKVEIGVEDNGQGIPRESIPKVFEMFYRASLDTEGTGLGLYIVKEALSKVKGTIAVRSEVGQGSLFAITLENA